jgi:hypothetical protein
MKPVVVLKLTPNQAAFLRMLLTTHTHVVELHTGRRCKQILAKLPRQCSSTRTTKDK